MKLDWQHRILIGGGALIAACNELSNTGHPIMVHGISLAVILGIGLAMFKASPLAPKDSP